MYNIFENRTLGNIKKCWYCGQEGFKMTKDHYYPKSLGGRLMVRCCHNCNGIKAAKTPIQWIHWIEESEHPQKERMLTASVSLGKKSEYVYKDGRRQKVLEDSFNNYI